MYNKLTVIVFESAPLSFVVELIFLISFILWSNIQMLVSMEYSMIQVRSSNIVMGPL